MANGGVGPADGSGTERGANDDFLAEDRHSSPRPLGPASIAQPTPALERQRAIAYLAVCELRDLEPEGESIVAREFRRQLHARLYPKPSAVSRRDDVRRWPRLRRFIPAVESLPLLNSRS